jgi:omega-6 fatty acid desaturase (delta-12 desaturase)
MDHESLPKPTSAELPTMAALKPMLEPFIEPSAKKAVWQLANTLIPYLVLWYCMWRSLTVSYALTLLLAIPTAGFFVRLFILFHDCGHNSFLPFTKANRRVGFWLGLLLFFPGEEWWHAHSIHHATNSNLDRRGIGDVTTMTVKEYQTASTLNKLWYRIFRFPPIMFGLGPLAMFVLANRFPAPRFGKKETRSVLLTDLGLAVIITLMSFLIGFKAYVMVQLPIIWIAGAFGIWLFYIQHQFTDMYWVRNSDWDYVSSALKGASYYQLPRLLQWFSGNIGFHHIHHLNPHIPNYELENCYRANPVLQTCAKTIPFEKAFPNMFLKLWDEDKQKMVGFKDLKPAIKLA